METTMKTPLLATATVAVLIACGSVLAAPTMYARMRTEVRQSRSFGAEVVTRLKQGDAVRVVEKSERHYRVSVGGREGWIYYNKLTSEKPEDIAALLGSAPSTAGMDLSEMEAGGALRGLSPAAEQYALAEKIPDWAVQAVERMHEMKATPDELDAFARSGGLGEYMEVQE
jgi:uncharacterized protein YgiM (DUF1202 family)